MTIGQAVKSLGARLTMSADDVRALLENDHDEVKELLKVMTEGKQGRSRSEALTKLKTNLTAHSRAEEQVVYDALIRARAKQEVHVLAEEGYVEHAAVEDLLVRISQLEVGTELWKAHAKVIRELLEHHISEEQEQTFAQLGDLFTREELVAMGEQFVRLKDRVLAKQASKTQRNVARVIAGQRARKGPGHAPAKKTSIRKAAKAARRPGTSTRKSPSARQTPGRRT